MAKNGRKGTPTVPDRSLIAGVDGADPGHAALMWAAAEASRRGLTLHIVNVEESLAARLPLGAALSEVTEVIEAGSTAILKHATESVADKYPELELTTAQPEDEPARWLIKASKSAALLVLGTHGKHKLTHAAVGTTAFKTASHAKCPVVLVHPDRKHEHASPARVVVGIDFSTSAQDALDFASTAPAPAAQCGSCMPGGSPRPREPSWAAETPRPNEPSSNATNMSSMRSPSRPESATPR